MNSCELFNHNIIDESLFCDKFTKFINGAANTQSITEFKTTIRIAYEFDFGVITFSARKLDRQFSKSNRPEFGQVRSQLTLSSAKFKLNGQKLFKVANVECKVRLDVLQPRMPVEEIKADIRIISWAGSSNYVISDIDINGVTMLKLTEPGLFN